MSIFLTPSFAPTIQDRIDSGKLVVFKIKVSDLVTNGLIIDPDGGTHAAVQPGMNMSEKQYQMNIRRTRSLWIRN